MRHSSLVMLHVAEWIRVGKIEPLTGKAVREFFDEFANIIEGATTMILPTNDGGALMVCRTENQWAYRQAVVRFSDSGWHLDIEPVKPWGPFLEVWK